MTDKSLAEYIERHPGFRPLHWWKSIAPAPRRRLGGLGTPLMECWPAYPKSLMYGIPECWCHAGDTFATPVSSAQPPLYESEAAFLDRHDLWLPGEKARVKDWRPTEVHCFRAGSIWKTRLQRAHSE